MRESDADTIGRYGHASADLPRAYESLEPGGTADEFIRATGSAAVYLATLIGETLTSTGLHGRLNELEQRIDTLNEKLDATNELLHNMLNVLSTGGGAV